MNDKRSTFVGATVSLSALGLLIAIALQVFVLNPGVDRNETNIKLAVGSQHAIICAQVQNVANAYRFRSLTPKGKVEPVPHFLTRMEAQAETLRLALGERCKSAPGFPPVGKQVRRALAQIKRIVDFFTPHEPRSVSRGVSQPSLSPRKHPSFSPAFSKPPDAGVDESGVPAILKPELAPSAPVLPQTGRQHKPPPPPEAPESPIEAPTPVEAQPSTGPGTNVAVAPKRPELPVVPVHIEIDVEPEGLPIP